MCGIVGYVGGRQAAPIILSGLEKLEYRGYDSAGVAVLHGHEIEVQKTEGRLAQLMEKTHDGADLEGSLGIGHTRWATHGEPSDRNAHPHLSQEGRFAVVHNGIIENYQELRGMLQQEGYAFRSETDSEVIAHLIEFYDEGDLLETLQKVQLRLNGSYAIGVLSAREPQKLYCCKHDAPLIVGLGEGENFFASDIPALLHHTRRCYLLEDGEIAQIDAQDVVLFNELLQPIEKEIYEVKWNIDAAEKGGYEHFMMKEIMEQPKALQETLRPRIQDGYLHVEELDWDEDLVQRFQHIYIVGCGSAYHVGVYGKEAIERMTRIPCSVEIASEFRYRDPILGEQDLAIFISQSGETADTLAALRLAKKQGARTLALVNVVGSTLARDADDVFYIWAGPEIAVATTKAYTCQAASLILIAAHLAKKRGTLSRADEEALCADFQALPEAFEKAMQTQEQMQRLAATMVDKTDIYFVGRSLDYALSLEGSLKLKEISYIHSEATPAGELKHGSISLIEEGTPVLALATWTPLLDKMLSNIREIESRGAQMLVFTLEEEKARFDGLKGDCVTISSALNPYLQALPIIVPLQFFAYYVSVLRGCDVDKPRNLAKSVTVE